MAFDTTDIVLSIVKIALMLSILLSITPVWVWVERRGAGLIQDRPGPNRVGPLGLLQTLADAVKFVFKEDIVPSQAHKWLHTLAPTFGLIPALTTIAVIPFGRSFVLEEREVFGRTLFEGGRLVEGIIADLNIGILLIFALSSLGVYGLATGGWASNNKYSLLGGIRASAQMISYELSLTLAAIGVLMAAGSLRLTEVVYRQAGYFELFGIDGLKIPAWNIFPMFLGFVVFLVSAFAETNRLPFDFPEAEAELVAGYHTEYSSMKFAMFFMGEYMAMGAISALTVTLFLGGWDIPWYNEEPVFLDFVLSFLAFLAKFSAMLFLFVWIRWTLPRLKFDYLMKIGWKIFLPLAILNILIVAVLIALGWI
ncbi:MAG TPA: NADH-quinone oxidoreductase subunit NuoH [Thermoanaerobaculia bacterium]|nr:NADH-quinone oxidoreductase subunit NuoH [Thermoanaerobaculia bacterium]